MHAIFLLNIPCSDKAYLNVKPPAVSPLGAVAEEPVKLKLGVAEKLKPPPVVDVVF